MRELILGIDFNNLVFASYYGSPLKNSNGLNVNAIKGFFTKLKMLKESFDPDYIVFANDISRSKTFRRQLYAPYKAQRKEHDEDILTQMKHIARMVNLLGYEFINNELYEADDVLGMISRYAYDNDMVMVIVSSDRDLYQLVNRDVYISSPRKNTLVDIEYIRDNYNLTPDQWIELKMLQGDRSDNIPGIYGVGEKTALWLMHEFKSIEGIYENLRANPTLFKPALKEALLNGEKNLPLTRELVTIITDYHKINLTSETLQRKQRYPSELWNLVQELQVYSLHEIMQYSLLPNKYEEVEK